MNKTIHILFEKPGLMTSVQDAGRIGFQSFGIPVGGAMDQFSARMANALVSNPKDGPILEITIQGPQIYFLADCQIAITGADISPKLDNQAIPNWETVEVRGGQRLQFGPIKNGCRAYLAIAGQWKLDPWLGSVGLATIFPEQLSPESLIKKGNGLAIDATNPVKYKILAKSKRPNYSSQPILEVLPGPEFDQLDRQVIAQFFGQSFQVGTSSNRMACVLDPPIPNYQSNHQLISSGIIPGTIQLTHEGRAIALMADAQTVGGYPRIAVLSRQALNRLAQCLPGTKIRFQLKA